MNFFDLHCDTAYECYVKNQNFSENTLAVSGVGGRCFERWCQSFAIWIKDDAQDPFGLYRRILEDFKKKLSAAPDNLTPLITVEGGAVLEDDLSRIDILKFDGVRALTLTWNGENRIAAGSKACGGLTSFGKKVIDTLEERGIAVDLSHLNDESFFAVADRERRPMASHSCCRAICCHPRNLTDEQLRIIAAKNGIIGLCLYPVFLGGDVFEMMYRNIYRMLDMGLEKNIAIGSDFDGAEMSRCLDNIAKIPLLYDFLQRKGINSDLLERIFYQNAAFYYESFDKDAQI